MKITSNRCVHALTFNCCSGFGKGGGRGYGGPSFGGRGGGGFPGGKGGFGGR